MLLNKPCMEECLWVLLDHILLCVVVVTGQTDCVLMAGLGHELVYGHIA